MGHGMRENHENDHLDYCISGFSRFSWFNFLVLIGRYWYTIVNEIYLGGLGNGYIHESSRVFVPFFLDS